MSTPRLQEPRDRFIPGPLALWGALMAVTLAIMYAPVVRELWFDWWHDDNYSHGVLVPAITAFLLWNRRDEFRARPVATDSRGLLLIVPSIGLLLLGTAGAEYFLQRVSGRPAAAHPERPRPSRVHLRFPARCRPRTGRRPGDTR